MSYAAHPEQTLGRKFKEQEDPGRSVFRRDCDRIIHSTAFRRLEYKTQVFVNHEGDHYRTRLTHTLEVAQIARSLARRLRVNEDLAEALALAHDLGHPPFGHAGEDVLNQQMEPFGGFDHNVHTFKILTQLEHRYADFEGLNLTWETLEGVVKHNGPITGKYRDKKRYDGNIPALINQYNAECNLHLDRFPSIEAQIASLADDIAYNNHDIDDGLRSGLICIEQLQDFTFFGDIIKEVKDRYGHDISQTQLIHESVRRIINQMVHDVAEHSAHHITAHNIKTMTDVHKHHDFIVSFSPRMHKLNQQLKEFLRENMYQHYELCRMLTKAKALLAKLFERLYETPECLPTEWRKMVLGKSDTQKAHIVGDFIAGMTDRYAIREYKRLFDVEYI